MSAALNAAVSHRVSLSFREGDELSPYAPWVQSSLEPAFEEDEHVFFIATLPSSAKVLHIRISAAPQGHAQDGAIATFESVWRKPPARERTPPWWKNAAIYTIFIDRFRPAHPEQEHQLPWVCTDLEASPAGGHLDGITRSLDHVASLGVNTLYLTPVHCAPSSHRYDFVDLKSVDPAIGGPEAYDALIAQARARGIRVIQDVSFAHAGWAFAPWQDVLACGEQSRFASWFVWKDGAVQHYGTRSDAPLINLNDPDVQTLVIETVAYWAKRGVSGLRLDMTAEVPLRLGRRIRDTFLQVVPDGVVLGEVVPSHAWRWKSAGVIDAATDFGFHEALTDFVCNIHSSISDTVRRLTRSDLLRGSDARSASVRFLSTHDHVRLATKAAAAGPQAIEKLPMAYLVLLTWPGVPMLLYGEELQLRSSGAARDIEDVWPDRAPMPWQHLDRLQSQDVPYTLIQALLRVRAQSAALAYGELEILFESPSTLVYRRSADGDVIEIALHIGDEPIRVDVADDDRPASEVLYQTQGARADGAAFDLEPRSAIVVRRSLAGATRAHALEAELTHNRLRRDSDFIAGRPRAGSRPTRFFFSVTENCNIQCHHCITHAPTLTRSGAARTLSPRVLDALRDDLRFANYAAFVHGGESLTAPIFFDVLRALKHARSAQPYVAHLLTNGMLLTEAVAAKLVNAGVCSISVSIDGATAQTNDAIRQGARLETILGNVRRVHAWRRERQVSLRLGLSFVVLSQNRHELEAFVDLASELGVDWIKFEEGAPSTEFARTSLVSCTSLTSRRAIARAVEHGRARGLVVVDHTIEREMWRCQLDDEARDHLAADEFANGSEIHPCRVFWDDVFIEPNGDVRIGDFFGPIVGNVSSEPLARLWNAPATVEARQSRARTRLCGAAGPVTCADRPFNRP